MARANGSTIPPTLTDLQDANRLLWKPETRAVSELPARYGRPQVTLMARDPGMLFSYWECDTRRATLAVRGVGPAGEDLGKIFEGEVMGVGSRYIEAPLGGGEYIAELVDASGNRWESLPVRTPPGRSWEPAGGSWTVIPGPSSFGLAGLHANPAPQGPRGTMGSGPPADVGREATQQSTGKDAQRVIGDGRS